MKKLYLYFTILFMIVSFQKISPNKIIAQDNLKEMDDSQIEVQYKYPDFYRGIYLNVVSARNIDRLTKFVKKAKISNINTFVLDVQSSKYKKCIVPKENIKYCIDNGIHPIARIVVFPSGLKYFPVSKKLINEKLDIAESACKSGFKEIQFDYIRFNDSQKLKYLSRNERYKFIEGFLQKAREHLKSYNIKIAADVFGRIPLNKGDIIGQRMEGLDKVVDVICPMAYPSHYTWSKKLQQDPYKTVYMTSKKANDRTENAEIVSYIQAFQIKLYNMPYKKYLKEQIYAVQDSGIKGFLLWNARQDYEVPFSAVKDIFINKVSKNRSNYNEGS